MLGCVRVRGCPATVSVPVRGVDVVLAVTEKLRGAVPEPGVPLVIVIQVALLDAVQPHPALVVTVTLLLPPAAGTFWFVPDNANAHMPVWLMATVRPATVSVPLRCDVVGFAVTE